MYLMSACFRDFATIPPCLALFPSLRDMGLVHARGAWRDLPHDSLRAAAAFGLEKDIRGDVGGMATGQCPDRFPPVNIPIPTNIGSKMGGEFTYPKMVPLVLTRSRMIPLADPKVKPCGESRWGFMSVWMIHCDLCSAWVCVAKLSG